MSLTVGQVSFKSYASGAQTVTATSGYTNVLGVSIYPFSGGPPNSSSGLTAFVFDGTSGQTLSGGATSIYTYGFGAQSGVGNSAPIVETFGGAPVPCTSGLVITSVAGWTVMVVYSK